MKCPKCGAGLQEIEMDGIMVDKCGGCEGIFFDRGELELMIESHKGGLGRLKKLFG
jgi:Zn-finger nucleic acid-binding protein